VPADGDGKVNAAEQRAQSFQAVEGAVQEDVPGGPLLLLGYGVLWVALLLYLIRLARQQQVLQRDLNRLERALGSAKDISAP
jgi:CcmD family protein